MSDTMVVSLPSNAWRHRPAQWWFWMVMGLTLAVDLGTKFLAFRLIPLNETVQVLPGLLNFHTVLNEGAVFGLGSGLRWIFMAATVAAAVFIIQLFAQSRPRQRYLHVLLALSLGGALGNLYDRIFYEKVRDFIHIAVTISNDVPLWPWIFNVADVALVVGIGTLLVGWTFGWIELQTGGGCACGTAKGCETTDGPPKSVD